MSYKLAKREYFRNLFITFKCHDCILFTWTKSTGGLFKIFHVKNNIKLNFDDQEVVIKADNKGSESTIEIIRWVNMKIILKKVILFCYYFASLNYNLDKSLNIDVDYFGFNEKETC